MNLKDGFKKFADDMTANLPNVANAQLAVVREEALELYHAYCELQEGKTTNEKELLDGIADTLFTGFVWGEMIGGNLAAVYLDIDNYHLIGGDKSLRQYYFDSFVDSMKRLIENKTDDILAEMMLNVLKFARTYKHDVIGALGAVVAENLTKIEYPPERREEVYRNNKLQKKDVDGVFYPWYKPAQFANYLRYENVFDLSDCLILDTETTGLDDNAEIVQIALVCGDEFVLDDELVKPTQAIPAKAAKIHGITTEMVATANPWSEMHEFVMDSLNTVEKIYIYNADYDTRLMKQTAEKYGLICKYNPNKVVCVMKKYAELWGELVEINGRWQHPWITLVKACEQQNIDISDLKAHNALNDCIMTLRLMQKINTGNYNTFKG